MNDIISVIITTYKRPTMLSRAINSVLNQTYSNIEVIVVDDNDENSVYRKHTESVMDQYKDNHKIKYIKHKKNMNGAVARNTGIKYSMGNIICFLDDDDWYLPNKLEKQYKYLIENNQFKCVYCGWNRNGKEVLPKKEGNLSFEILSGNSLIYTNTIMMWKDIAIKIGGWDERFKRNQEAAFLLRYFKSENHIGVVSEALVQFDTSDRSNALDSIKNENQFEFYLKEHEDIILELCKQNKKARKIIYSWRYRGILLAHINSKKFYNAINVYIKMMKYIPIMFNKDLIIYILNKICKKDICDY